MKSAEAIVAKLKQLDAFAEDGCGNDVVSHDDVLSVIAWAEDDGMTDAELQEMWDDAPGQFGYRPRSGRLCR